MRQQLRGLAAIGGLIVLSGLFLKVSLGSPPWASTAEAARAARGLARSGAAVAWMNSRRLK